MRLSKTEEFSEPKPEPNVATSENELPKENDKCNAKIVSAPKDSLDDLKAVNDSDDDDDEEFTDKMFEDLGLDPSMVSIVPRSKQPKETKLIMDKMVAKSPKPTSEIHENLKDSYTKKESESNDTNECTRLNKNSIEGE